uniref:Uncharacterized protein n=1 Tax=Oryza meridionalis TaxID=40149 RepID=A0A0E0ENA1_9ORYZ
MASPAALAGDGSASPSSAYIVAFEEALKGRGGGGGGATGEWGGGRQGEAAGGARRVRRPTPVDLESTTRLESLFREEGLYESVEETAARCSPSAPTALASTAAASTSTCSSSALGLEEVRCPDDLQLLGRRLREGLHCGYGIADLAKYITIDACYAIEKRRYKVEGTTGENQHAEATALFKKTIWYSKEMILCWPRKSVN